MSADVIERVGERVKERFPNGAIDILEEAGIADRPFRLSDAIRAGSKVSKQAYTWTDGENLCALSAAAVFCEAHGMLPKD